MPGASSSDPFTLKKQLLLILCVMPTVGKEKFGKSALNLVLTLPHYSRGLALLNLLELLI